MQKSVKKTCIENAKNSANNIKNAGLIKYI